MTPLRVAAINQTGGETIQAIRASGIERPRDLSSANVWQGATTNESLAIGAGVELA